jgi:Esterase-like activity of phytase
VPEGFLVLERDDDAVPAADLGAITKKIYAFNLTGATDISGRDGVFDVGAGVMKSLDQMTNTELSASGVVPIAKTLNVDLASAGFAGVQKVEGLALLGDGRLAVINDNDFQVAQITIDSSTGTFASAPGYMPESTTVGLISRPGLDASDRDSRINISPWPVLGMFEPDAIASFKSRGHTYLVTANEGDARDWPGYTEEVRVGSSTVALDPTLFPNATVLKNTANLGRLNVTKAQGDLDGDGDYDVLFTLGGRSFSIWSAGGKIVFDSESALERITSSANPARFNAGHDDSSFDNRSDNKGPEPEGLAIGEIGDRIYAFIGLERIGGVVTYDITNPQAPLFVDYVNNRTFTGTPEAGDLGPEGLLFIPAQSSPTRRPLLVVTNEVSGTVTTYSLGD